MKKSLFRTGLIAARSFTLLALSLLIMLVGAAKAQNTETFDIATFQVPKGWQKSATASSLQISTEDKANGTYCVVSILKSLPAPGSPKENFDSAWKTVVKGLVNVASAPQMMPSENKERWQALGGFAPFEKEGERGVVVLMNISGYGTMVNVVVLTNTQAYEATLTAFLESISLKEPVAQTGPRTAAPSAGAKSDSTLNGYGFTTTNFDDGWTATAQEDWVHVSKGSTVVLIHHPNKQADAYNSVVMDGLKKAWDVLIAPRYKSASNFHFRPITGWQAIEYAEADMVPNGSSKAVHVVLFKMNYSSGAGRYMEFIAPSKGAFEQEFGPYRESTSGWEKMERMVNYNKFGIAAHDLKGKWTNDFSGSLSFVNAYTGAAAYTDTHASIENFSFGANGSYSWDLGVASGAVGNIKFQGAKGSGKVTVPGVWKLAFSSISGKPRTYDAHFSFVKGGRILWLDGRAFGRLN